MRMARRLPDDIYDPAIAAVLHTGKHGLDHGKEPEHLVTQLLFEDPQSCAFDRATQMSSGVVDQNVNVAEGITRRVDEPDHRSFVGDVGRNADDTSVVFGE